METLEVLSRCVFRSCFNSTGLLESDLFSLSFFLSILNKNFIRNINHYYGSFCHCHYGKVSNLKIFRHSLSSTYFLVKGNRTSSVVFVNQVSCLSEY